MTLKSFLSRYYSFSLKIVATIYWYCLAQLLGKIYCRSAVYIENKEDIKYIYKLVSERIKLFRNYRGLTQEQLALKTTFSRGLIGNIESAKTTQTFSLAVLYAFSKGLDIPLEMFVKEDISDYLKEIGLTEKQ